MLTLSFDKFPVLETERLILRAISQDDVVAMFHQRSRKELMEYISIPLLQSKKEAEDLVKNYQFLFEQKISISWAITIKGNPEMIGTVGYPRISKENYRGEIGYSLDPAYWGKGYMNEAVADVLKYGFDNLKFHRIEAVINPKNKASVNLALKHGFVKEAYFKDYTFFEGAFWDTEVYSLLASDYR
ncbi:GNAT family protein [Dyadobacter sp. LHD-138]|uniref:GNAT family N-acetyltransferase n=1 Tax=Dyadobacter sp. LHD-138 TaxID=3071413 RepID=UPI0027E11E87|nr:GNAT family protein [Dyadobacter sp. LHD-138]MDQ6481932.1 GNAT family protein [Dyadobacter sp. LHD-138]